MIPRRTHYLDASEDEPYAMLDLTNLLATGRASEALADFLGSGEQMTERVLSNTVFAFFPQV